MNSDHSDQNDIRAKRIARLQALQQQQQRSLSESAEPATPATPSASTTPATPVHAPTLSSSSTAASPVQNNDVPQRSNSVKEGERLASNSPVAHVTAKSPSSSTLSSPEWVHRSIAHILQLQGSAALPQGPDLLQEILSESNAEFLNIDSLDTAILTIMMANVLTDSLGYLVRVWSAAYEAKRAIRTTDPEKSSKYAVFDEIMRLSASYAFICISQDAVFGPSSALSSLLTQSSSSSVRISDPMLYQIADVAKQEDALSDLFIPCLRALAQLASGITMAESTQCHTLLLTLQTLVSIPGVPDVITSSEYFLPESLKDGNGSSVEYETLLGPFYGISPVSREVSLRHFDNAETMSPSAIESARNTIAHEQQAVSNVLFNISDKIVRASPSSRNALLNFFAVALNMNHKRRALQVDASTIATEGFMLNLTSILARFASPFIDATFSKLDKVDPFYLINSSRIDVFDETKLNSDEKSSESFYKERRAQNSAQPNFISDIFYLNVACLHYGLGGCLQGLEHFDEDIKNMKKQVERLEQGQAGWINSSRANMFTMALNNFRKKLNEAIAFQNCLQAAIFDITNMSRAVGFYGFYATWFMRFIDEHHAYPSQVIKLPLSDEFMKSEWLEMINNIPEYFVESVAFFVKHVAQRSPNVLYDPYAIPLAAFCAVFLYEPRLIHNPFVKSKMVECLFYGILPQQYNSRGFFADCIHSDPTLLRYLFHGLMEFYIDVEQTGASSQFYDKFNIRYYISQIVKFVWTNNHYRQQLLSEAADNQDFFVRFVALLLNDVTYLLDESLSKLSEIHRLQTELARGNVTSETTNEEGETETTDTQTQLASAERQATSYVSLANETVAMFKLFTSAATGPFVTPEIVDRLAAMLDYNLAALVGPKCTDLKVQNPQNYRFSPKQLLSDILDIYLNLKNEHAFLEAVARDGRSYNYEIFLRASSILTRYSLKSSKDIAQLKQLADTVESIKQSDIMEEEELGDVPDEYLDPLVFTLMKEPVILPASKVTLDLSTIKSHLLSDPTDPFNRMPLKLEDVQPNEELRQEIENYVKTHRKK
ncbi:hypothetical protein CANCADRAFT_2415 [Tortispora caseinolytica NRRL Y-17796]|uniref:RING-type E3 ubiquitin transferase n=1 Tax=Tortispora caseinolytica NRRL Y-17796 TaxID=767744 RepID=A0A1E4TFY9_9ASCO|nr:hypothetical protein CANCADRAFT_2415 [Tortispora caseinolytica NRRL Y-17796]